MRDSIPTLSGTNGETDEAEWADVERRWQAPAPEERIGETCFSLWKTEVPLAAKAYRFSPTFFAVTILGSAGLIALGAWTADRIRQGDFLAGKIFFVVFFMATYGSAIVAIIMSRRKKLPAGEPMLPPVGVPPSAVACHVRISRRGRCVGWLRFEGDLMVFQGAGFDFRLRHEDFGRSRSLFKALSTGGRSPLKGPRRRLRIQPVPYAGRDRG